MQNLLISLILLFSFTGCEDKEQLAKEQAEHDAKIIQQARIELLEEIKAEQIQDEKLIQEKLDSTMGINIDKSIITIDTNKTKDFLRDLSKKMDTQIKKISDDFEKGIIKVEKAGIDINENHLHIDINKTQNLLEDWGKKIQVFVEEVDKMADNLDTNNTNKGI